MFRLKLWWAYQVAWAKIKRRHGGKTTEFEDFVLRVEELCH